MSFDPLVTQMWSRDGFSISTDNGIQRKAKIQTGYQITAPANFTVEQVRALLNIQTGQPYPNLPTIFAKNFDFQKAGPTYWTATVSWDGEFGPGGAHIAATQTPPEVTWSDVETEEEIDETFDGKPITTANGELIEGVTVKLADQIVNIRRKFNSFSPAATHAYRHSVNSDEFLGYPAGTARLVRFTAKQVYEEGGGGYWDVDASIQFRYPWRTTPERAWYARLIHQGFLVRMAKPGGTPDANGNLPSVIVNGAEGFDDKLTRPVNLDEEGFQLADGADPHWLEFQRYPPLPYNALGLI